MTSLVACILATQQNIVVVVCSLAKQCKKCTHHCSLIAMGHKKYAHSQAAAKKTNRRLKAKPRSNNFAFGRHF
jgi:hypothetical protein